MFKFLEGLDKDIQQTLLKQIRDLWTHNSTALEGNTLTLGDTKFVLDEGLTVSGKPIKDHEEVVGHARAIDLVYALVGHDVTEQDIFELHKAVQTERISDICKPYGAWKVETNGTYAVNDEGEQVFIGYAHPRHVPFLMGELITQLNVFGREQVLIDDAEKIYAKIHMGLVHIHPFWDGNGRIARILANLPLLNSGLPPILIPKEMRREYIRALSQYQLSVGELTNNTGVWPNEVLLGGFNSFCLECYEATKDLVSNAECQQVKRNESY